MDNIQIDKGHYKHFMFSVLSDYISYVYDAILYINIVRYGN